MRGRRGRSSSSVCQVQDRMPLRKQAVKDAGDFPSGSQQFDDSTQDEDEALDDNGELSSSLLPPSSSKEKRKRERESRSKPKEMTEEEMMDLALRLSEQEASITALRLQKEEEAVMKAIHESMASQAQPCLDSQSQSLLTEASRWTGSRRKLSFSNGRPVSDMDQGESEDCTEIDHLSQGTKRSGDESNNRNKRRKRKAGSPLLEMPDLSQTQIISSQGSSPSSQCLVLNLDSQQSSESTQIDECQLRKSPVFPLTGCRPEVHVPRLSQDLLQTVRTSGFVLCTQDSETLPARPKSPTFPRSPKRPTNHTARPKSPVFKETVPADDDDEETDSSPGYLKSPVFGRNTQREKSPSACKPQISVCNSGFTCTSQESFTSSVRSASCRQKSPVFPRSPVPPPRETSDSVAFPETDVGQTRLCRGPALDRSRRRPAVQLDEQKESTGGRTQDSQTNDTQDVRLNKTIGTACLLVSEDTQDLNETPKDTNSAETELTSDMKLLWSDSDEDVTVVVSPSPVFPEEKPVCEGDGQAASLSLEAAAPPGTGTDLSCRPSSSSSSSGRLQLSTAGREHCSTRSGEPAGEQTVHYYWGVPFCPRGLDPDTYTQVILAQMEVYEKSLKQAQRGLLRKAEWGEAILPQPEKSPSPESPADSPQPVVPRRRGLRLNRQRLCDAAETPPVEVEDEEDNRGEEGVEEVQEEVNRETGGEEEEKKDEGDEGGQVDTDVCEVCPETQLSDDDRTQDLMMDASPQLRPKSLELPEVEMILPDDSPAKEEPREEEEEEMEVEVDDPADRDMKGSAAVGSSDAGLRNKEIEEDMEDPSVEEIKDGGLHRSTSQELEPAVVPQSPESSVDCPICQQSFPVTEIEMHAAYCDGEVAVMAVRRPKANCSQASLKPRRKRTRRTDVTPEDTNDSSDSNNRNQEKCFICQKTVPQRDFGRHTELCLQRRASRPATKGNLLSALEQTEGRDSEPGPSGSRLQTGDVIELLDDDDDEEEEEGGAAAAFSISNSPIRTFTPISEATGCLIDFKKPQRSKRLSQRRK